MKCFVYNKAKMIIARNSALEDMRRWKGNKGYLEKDLIRIFIANNLNRFFGAGHWNADVVDGIMHDMLYNFDIVCDKHGEYYVISSE